MSNSYATASGAAALRGNSDAPFASAGFAARATAPSALAKQPDWAPRLWSGCDFPVWLRLLVHNRWAVAPRFWYIAVAITIMSFANTLLRLVETAIYGRAVRGTKVEPPIFVIGHWRTGTTLLHELMVRDERFGYPTTYQCLEPITSC